VQSSEEEFGGKPGLRLVVGDLMWLSSATSTETIHRKSVTAQECTLESCRSHFKKGSGRTEMEGTNQTGVYVYVYMEISQRTLLYNYHIRIRIFLKT
jgi:hypothetical protein